MSKNDFSLAPMTGSLGAEVRGVDLRKPVSEELGDALRAAFTEHLVLVFRDQELTPMEQGLFASTFGPLEPHPFVESLPGESGLIEIVKEPDETVQWGGIALHADLTFLEAPPRGALLYAREVPPIGGDTLFVNLPAFYDSLSTGLRQTLKGLRAVHASLEPRAYSAEFKGMKGREAARDSTAVQTYSHPVVIRHPVSGRESLYVNALLTKHFEGMSVEESRPLLDMLIEKGQDPAFSCRVRWQPGTAVVWDNRVTWHCALNDDFAALRGEKGYRRVMHRATLAGQKPEAA